MKIPNFALALTCAALAPWAQGQAVVQSKHVQIQPQIGRDHEGFNVCGIRAVVLDDTGSGFDGYDFSINVMNGADRGLVKAGKTSNLGKAGGKPVLAVPGPTNFWIVQESESKPFSINPNLKTTTPGYLLGSSDMLEAWRMSLAIARGDQMQFAMRYEGQKYDTVISFKGNLTEAEYRPLLACFDGLVKRMQSELDAISTTIK